MISVVCVYNNLEIYNRFLYSSIQTQEGDHELIAIDNRDGHFRSAAQALNYGGEKSTGSYIMFAHQDVSLGSNHWLNRAEEMLKALPNLGIAGVAGRKDASGTIAAITHGNPPRQVGVKRLSEPLRVQTVDECLFFIPAEVFAAVNLDERTCDGWHLYSVEYSLSTQKRGLAAFVLPLGLHHESTGHLSDEYFTALKNVIGIHRKDYLTIFTTMGNWNTIIPMKIQMTHVRLWERIHDFLELG